MGQDSLPIFACAKYIRNTVAYEQARTRLDIVRRLLALSLAFMQLLVCPGLVNCRRAC